MARKGKNKIEVKLIQGNNINTQTRPDMVEYKRLVTEGEKVEKASKPALLISRLDYPVIVNYGDSQIRLSPRCHETVGDVSKLDKELPKGIFVKKITRVKDKKDSEL